MIVLPATVNGISGNFILDTGIPHAVLNAAYFDGQEVDRVYSSVLGTTPKIKASHVKVQLDALCWKGVYAEILPLEHLETIKGMPILGLIGGRMLRKYMLWIDYEQQYIWLEKEGSTWETSFFPAPTKESVLEQVFRFKNGSPSIQIQLGKSNYLFSLDTGAETNIIDTKYRSTFAPYFNLERQKVLSSFTKSPDRITSTLLYGMNVSGLACQPMISTFLALGEWNTSTKGPKVAGILGYEFLHQFRVCINFKSRILYLIPADQHQKRVLYMTKK
ncbi:MAG: retropepsin-like domain-containing protein [Saprospiraceae bacterium]|nr:retropepsin-like domain-containing protein [Saprospiraceae bacterium]